MNEHIKNATEYAFNNNVAEMQSEIEAALQYKIINAIEAEKIEVAKSLMNVRESHEDLEEMESDLENLSKKAFKEKHELSKKKAKKWMKEALSPKQKKIASLSEPKDKIDAGDLKKLRKEDVEQVEEGSGPKEKQKQKYININTPEYRTKVDEFKEKLAKDKAAQSGKDLLNKINKKKSVKEGAEQVDEKLTSAMPASKVIQDFVHSDDPKFKGKSKKERIKMALGAFYGMHPEKSRNEEVEQIHESSNEK